MGRLRLREEEQLHSLPLLPRPLIQQLWLGLHGLPDLPLWLKFCSLGALLICLAYDVPSRCA